ncbi:MAG TPA: DUF4034 domain-containing protein [Planktothrix sp.]|jgi:hypothetical protein
MKRSIYKFMTTILLSLSAFASTGSAYAARDVTDDIDTDAKARSKLIQSYLLTHNYTALDKMADQLRASKAQYPDGNWKLDYFYGGLYNNRPTWQMSSEEWLPLMKQTSEWVKARPKSVTAKISYAAILINYAWAARGGGYADSVSKDAWAAMQQREQAAVSILNDARKLPATCPRWWYYVLYIGKDQSYPNDFVDKLLAEAKAKYPTYRKVCFIHAAALDPRWGGNDGDVERYAESSANAYGGDTVYAQVLWWMDALPWYRGSNVIQELHFNSARAEKGFEALLKQYPNSLSVISEYSRIACLSGDYAKAKSLFKTLNGRLDPHVYYQPEEFDHFHDTAFGSGG